MGRDNIKFVGNGVTVYMATTGAKENITNSFKVVTIPTTDSTPNTSSLVNLNKVEDRFTLKGFLNNGKLGTETHTTAKDKKVALKTMFGLGSVIVMTWDDISYNVGVDKYEIDYQAKDDKDDVSDGVIVYDVQITCVVGSDIV